MTWLRGARCTDPSPPRRELRRMPETEARPRVKNLHGGAPRGERPASWDARRLARRLACRVSCTPNGCLAQHPNVSRRSAAASAKLMNSLGNPRRCGAIPGFFPVCKTGALTPAQRCRTPTRHAADAEQLQQHLDPIARLAQAGSIDAF